MDKKPNNLAYITLIPKVENADRNMLFTPIACCNELYKIISKVITNRIKGVLGNILNKAQDGFIPERQLSDNILLASGL